MRIRSVAVATACALAGAGAGALLNASAAPKPSAAKAKGGVARRAVHVEAVVRRPDGSYPTITIDRGTLKAVDGARLTIDEGYKTVTVDAGGSPVVRLNRQAGSLSALQDGDRVAVRRGPKKVAVRARR